MSDERVEVKCGACGEVGLIIGDCATECEHCGASVDPETGEPFTGTDGKIVYCSQFGGRHVP